MAESVIRRDRAIYAFILGYFILGWLISSAIGESDKFVPLVYLGGWLVGLVFAGSVAAAYLLIKALLKPEPAAELVRSIKVLATRQTAESLTMFMGLGIFYGVFTSVKTMLPDIATFSWDADLAHLDAVLHGQDPWLYLRFLNPLTGAIEFLYGRTWFMFTALSIFLICLFPSLRPVRRQFIWTFMLCWSVFGNLVAGLFLSGGPIFYERLTGSARFSGLLHHLSSQQEAPALIYSNLLWDAYKTGAAGLGSGISAFPSMHLSMATLFALLTFRTSRGLWYAALAHLVVIMAGSVHLGWHYAVDGYVSILATFMIWKFAGAMQTAPRVKMVVAQAAA